MNAKMADAEGTLGPPEIKNRQTFAKSVTDAEKMEHDHVDDQQLNNSRQGKRGGVVSGSRGAPDAKTTRTADGKVVEDAKENRYETEEEKAAKQLFHRQRVYIWGSHRVINCDGHAGIVLANYLFDAEEHMWTVRVDDGTGLKQVHHDKLRNAAGFAFDMDDTMPTHWCILGLLIPRNEWVTMPSGDAYDAKGAFKKALEMDPEMAFALYHLGWALGPDETVNIDDEKEWNQRMLLVRGTELSQAKEEFSQTNAEMWTGIATMLPLGETVTIGFQKYNQRNLCIKALELDPLLPQAWYAFSQGISATEVNVRIGETQYNVKTALLKALELATDYNYGAAWLALGNALGRREIIEVNGNEYDRKGLWLKALEFDPALSEAWQNLGIILQDEESVHVANYGEFDHKALCLRALEWNPALPKAWCHLGVVIKKEEEPLTVPLFNMEEHESFDRIGLCVKALGVSPECDMAWTNLGDILPSGEKVTVDDEEFDRQQLYLRALTVNDKWARAWSGLCSILAEGEEIKVDGIMYDRRRLALKALNLDSDIPEIWLVLSDLMQTMTDQIIVDGAKYNKIQACLAAINLKPTFGMAWGKLGACFPQGDDIEVLGKEYDRKSILWHALELDQDLADSWKNIGFLMRDKETITVAGVEYEKKAVSLKALSIDKTLYEAWCQLVNFLEYAERIEVNGESFDQKDLCRKCLDINPEYHIAWAYLGRWMRPGETFTFQEVTYNQTQLFARSLEIDPEYAPSWCNLGSIIHPEEKAIVNGKEFDRQSLVIQAIDLDPSLAATWCNLSLMIEYGEIVQVRGKRYDWKGLCQEALDRDRTGVFEKDLFPLRYKSGRMIGE